MRAVTRQETSFRTLCVATCRASDFVRWRRRTVREERDPRAAAAAVSTFVCSWYRVRNVYCIEVVATSWVVLVA